MRKLYCLVLSLLTFNCFAQIREIAITLDDLPFVASKMDTPVNQKLATERFMRIIKVLTKHEVPATGFVIAGGIAKGQWSFIKQFHDAGFMIGNHTYSHFNLNETDAEKYIDDVARADKILAPLITEPKYFRYPYLAEGSTKTKPQVLDYLDKHHYIVAPVTIDSDDFRFNAKLYKVPMCARKIFLSKLKSHYLTYIWQETLKAEERNNGKPGSQIILLHMNLINSYLLDDIIQMYKQNGYKFISLTEALKNPAPFLIFPAPGEEGDPNGYYTPRS